MKRFITTIFLAVFVCHLAWGDYDSRENVIAQNTCGAIISFSTDNTYEWKSDYFYNEGYKLKSTNYNQHNTTSQTTITISNDYPCAFSFNYAVSSETNYDKLTIILDGNTIVNGISGSVSRSYSSRLSAGTHSLVLKYSKDNIRTRFDDTAYISNVKLKSFDWSFNSSTATLTVWGSGELYLDDYDLPWEEYKSNTKNLILEGNITGVRSSLFKDFDNLSHIVTMFAVA